MRKKIYKHSPSIAILVGMIAVFIFSFVFIFVTPALLWFFCPLSIIVALSMAVLSWEGYFNFIYLSEDGIEFKGEKYLWSEIKITAYRGGGRNFSYYLLIGRNYLHSLQEVKRQMRCGPCVYLENVKRLELLSANYQAKFVVLDSDANETADLTSTEKINNAIKEHNRKYS